jgi:hypothetical protein
MHTPLHHFPAKPSMHSLPHIPKLHSHSKNTTPTNKTSAKSKSPLNKEKRNPKNQLQSVRESKRASNDNSPHCKHTTTCCNCLLWKIRVPISSKPTEQEKQFQIPNSNKSGLM